MTAARYELGIDAAKLDAVDMHVHLEVDGHGHQALPRTLTEASAKYFNASDRTPSLDRIAEVYRELNMAAVVFTVDARTQLKHESNSIPELIAGAARNNDVLIPFGSVDPRTGQDAIASHLPHRPERHGCGPAGRIRHQAGVFQSTPARCSGRGFPRAEDHYGPPFSALAGRSQLDSDAQYRRIQ
jgi:predicted TIM-barrel fold metal-dependent hydrolase